MNSLGGDFFIVVLILSRHGGVPEMQGSFVKLCIEILEQGMDKRNFTVAEQIEKLLQKTADTIYRRENNSIRKGLRSKKRDLKVKVRDWGRGPRRPAGSRVDTEPRGSFVHQTVEDLFAIAPFIESDQGTEIIEQLSIHNKVSGCR
ncbi:hypothetical protein CDAR_213331 [Caerostris darwini]|uniref:Uncharacterized protein n=1 Tax=Caerostris darwini TaxID=1538125 RepID=A0AAV4PUI9_9ARAC|nr:hypothetical protein CDAR_213331 [Caerostris darwini]